MASKSIPNEVLIYATMRPIKLLENSVVIVRDVFYLAPMGEVPPPGYELFRAGFSSIQEAKDWLESMPEEAVELTENIVKLFNAENGGKK